MKTRQPEPDDELTDEMGNALLALDKTRSKAVVDHLDKNPAEVTRIAKLAKNKQAEAIFTLDEQLKRPKKKEEPMEAYAKRRNGEIAKSRRRTPVLPGFAATRPAK